jgi:hypothetical protein
MPTTSSCSLCGWEGDPRPRKKFYPEDLAKRKIKTRKWRALKSEGKLHFIRVFIEGGSAELKTISENIHRFLKEHSLEWDTLRHFESTSVFAIHGEKPDKDILKKMSEIAGITQIVVY